MVQIKMDKQIKERKGGEGQPHVSSFVIYYKITSQLPARTMLGAKGRVVRTGLFL